MKNYNFNLPFFLILLISITSISSCKKTSQNPIPAWDLPYFGFNAKGTLEVAEQTQLANTYLNEIPVDIKKNLAIRVTGGTHSQITYNSSWTDDNINKWVKLQQTHGLKFIFVVNGNDAPINQKNLIQRWINAGARFDFLEMMQEYYLVKYALGDTTKKEVTEKVSAKKYVDTILPNFWNQLDVFNLPYYVILAPTGPTNLQTYYKAWNDTVINAIENKYASRKLNATVHCYSRGANIIFDYNQISNLKSRLPVGSHLAITEAGITDTTLDNQQVGIQAIEHYKKILTRLSKGDYLLDQVLYFNLQYNNTANLSPLSNGATPKGELLLTFIKNRLQ